MPNYHKEGLLTVREAIRSYFKFRLYFSDLRLSDWKVSLHILMRLVRGAGRRFIKT